MAALSNVSKHIGGLTYRATLLGLTELHQVSSIGRLELRVMSVAMSVVMVVVKLGNDGSGNGSGDIVDGSGVGGGDVGGDGDGGGGDDGGGGCLLSRTLCSLLIFVSFQDLTLAGCLPRRPSILSGPWSLALGISSAWLLTTSSKNLCLRQNLYDT